MIEKKVTLFKKIIVTNRLGIHARPAAIIAKIARKAKGEVRLSSKEKTINATSMINILTLSCSKGTEITILLSKKSDYRILEEIASSIASNFGE